MNNKIIRIREDSVIKCMHINSELFKKINNSKQYQIMQIIYLGDIGEINLFVEYVEIS